MQNNEQKAGTAAEKRNAADLIPSASLVQNGLLSAALSVDGNKLIAEFMKQWKGVDCYRYGKDYYGFENLRYHLSWDWLMPVVEKIEGLGFTFIIDGVSAYCYEKGKIMEGKSGIAKTKIEAVWIAVIKFIKWQNDNVDVGSR